MCRPGAVGELVWVIRYQSLLVTISLECWILLWSNSFCVRPFRDVPRLKPKELLRALETQWLSHDARGMQWHRRCCQARNTSSLILLSSNCDGWPRNDTICHPQMPSCHIWHTKKFSKQSDTQKWPQRAQNGAMTLRNAWKTAAERPGCGWMIWHPISRFLVALRYLRCSWKRLLDWNTQQLIYCIHAYVYIYSM